MKLMNKKLWDKLDGFDFENPDKNLYEQPILVKYFDPFSHATWILTEGEIQEDGDVIFFGYCYIQCGEWGNVSLSELESLGPHRIKIDESAAGKTIAEEFKLMGWKIPT